MLDRLGNFFRTGAGQVGSYAPGVMVTVLSVAGTRFNLIPPAVANVVNRVPLMLWGAGAGYAFALPGEDASCAALKGAAGTAGASMALAAAGVRGA